MKIMNKLLLIALAILTFSCEDILEEDITNDLVQTVYPTEATIVQSSVTTFQWNALKGAKDYRIQVYKDNQLRVYDTLVAVNSVTLPLFQGTYQWRVRGENAGYESSYSFPITFKVEESKDLTNQPVTLLNPVDNAYIKENTVTLSWGESRVVDKYKVEVDKVTPGISVYANDNVTSNSVSLTSAEISQEGKYTWRVKAFNTETETETNFYSRSFIIDRTPPSQPLNSEPAPNAIFNTSATVSVIFKWTPPANTGTEVSPIDAYEIQIANDINFTNNVTVNTVNTNEYSQFFTTTGERYWRVKAKDKAGNVGIYGTASKLTIN